MFSRRSPYRALRPEHQDTPVDFWRPVTGRCKPPSPWPSTPESKTEQAAGRRLTHSWHLFKVSCVVYCERRPSVQVARKVTDGGKLTAFSKESKDTEGSPGV